MVYDGDDDGDDADDDDGGDGVTDALLMADVLLATRVAGHDQDVDCCCWCCCWCVVSSLSWMTPHPSSTRSVHLGWPVL